MDERQLGFAPELRIGFKQRLDFMDYTDIFCCDLYETCPVYKAITRERYKG